MMQKQLLPEEMDTNMHAWQMKAICGYVGSCMFLLVEEGLVWSPPHKCSQGVVQILREPHVLQLLAVIVHSKHCCLAACWYQRLYQSLHTDTRQVPAGCLRIANACAAEWQLHASWISRTTCMHWRQYMCHAACIHVLYGLTCVLMIGLISTEDRLWLVVAVAPAAALAMNKSLVLLCPGTHPAKLPAGRLVSRGL